MPPRPERHRSTRPQRQLHRVHRGVYAVGYPALTLTGRFVAAVLACGHRASLSFFACGAYWEFMRWEERLIDVTVIGTTTRRIAGVRVHRARSLDERDVWQRDGMRVTSPARTLLDLAAVLPPDALLDLLDAGIERPEIDAPLRLDGRRIVPDYLWRQRRIAIEADSRRWHDDPLTRRNDDDKQAILEAHDYRVLRIADHQITDHPQQTLARVRRALGGA
jgi:hypothetical protein